MSRRMMLVIPVLLLGVACSGAGAGGTARIDAAVQEFEFSPKSWSIPAGAEVTLSLTNEGSMAHTFALIESAQPPTSSDELEQATLLHETGVAAGETVEAVFTAPAEPGTYQVVCGVPGHLDAGMTATLTVSES